MSHSDYDADDGWDDVDDSDDGYMPCPHCGATMLEDAEYCPACDRWMTSEDQPDKRHPWWIIVVIGALILVMILSVLP